MASPSTKSDAPDVQALQAELVTLRAAQATWDRWRAEPSRQPDLPAGVVRLLTDCRAALDADAPLPDHARDVLLRRIDRAIRTQGRST